MRGSAPNERQVTRSFPQILFHGHDLLDTEFDIHDNRLFILS
jgi:hypothetical protein